MPFWPLSHTFGPIWHSTLWPNVLICDFLCIYWALVAYQVLDNVIITANLVVIVWLSPMETFWWWSFSMVNCLSKDKETSKIMLTTMLSEIGNKTSHVQIHRWRLKGGRVGLLLFPFFPLLMSEEGEQWIPWQITMHVIILFRVSTFPIWHPFNHICLLF